MTKARILADYVAGGVTAAEFDRLDGIGSAAVGISDSQTLTNKTLTSPTLSTPALDSIKTVTNSYDYIKGGELNSLGYLQHNFFGASYYLSSAKTIVDQTWVEVDATWTKMITSGSSGSDDADIFGKFSSGRWTPTISGYYLCVYNSVSDGAIDSGEWWQTMIRKNSDGNSGYYGGRMLNYSPATNSQGYTSGAIILPCDTNDYISLWVRHNEGGGVDIYPGETTISFSYMGTSDL